MTNSLTVPIVVQVSKLSAGYLAARKHYHPIIHNINLTIRAGERVGLIGRSGAGKSTLARALCGLMPTEQIISGSVRYNEQWRGGEDNSKDAIGKWKSNSGYIFQNPYGCLNPTMSIGAILREQLRITHRTHHTPPVTSRAGSVLPAAVPHDASLATPPRTPTRRIQYDQEALTLLKRLDFAEPEQLLNRRPHQLSRGMCQRIAIALSMITRPRLLICDEPTSALDSDAEHQVCQTLCTTEIAAALLFITHNIQLVLAICDRILVLDDGRIVDDCSIKELQHGQQRSKRAPVTIEYLTAAERIAAATRQPHWSSFSSATNGIVTTAPLATDTATLSKSAVTPSAKTVADDSVAPLIRMNEVFFAYRLRAPHGMTRRGPEVLRGLSLTIAHQDSVGIIGKSGSGKSTLLGVLIALLRPQAGEYFFDDQRLFNQHRVNRATLTLLRRKAQLIPQDPSESLPPYQSIEQTIAEPLRLQKKITGMHNQNIKRRGRSMTASDMRTRVRTAADEAGVAEVLLSRYPRELSVGQQQRALIARALILSPTLILADEPFSAIDSRMQSQLIGTLQQLQQEHDLSLCVVSHRPEVLIALSRHHYRLQNGQLELI